MTSRSAAAHQARGVYRSRAARPVGPQKVKTAPYLRGCVCTAARYTLSESDTKIDNIPVAAGGRRTTPVDARRPKISGNFGRGDGGGRRWKPGSLIDQQDHFHL